jgi:hypothetical protein
MVIQSLFDIDGGGWDHRKLRSLFDEESVTAIIKILLPLQDKSDTLV